MLFCNLFMERPSYIIWWCNQKSIRLATKRYKGQHGQVIHIHMPVIKQHIIWYWPEGGGALRLGKLTENDSSPQPTNWDHLQALCSTYKYVGLL